MDFNIITFHRALNHGAVLQTYALQTYLEQLGFSAGVYDYSPSAGKRYAGIKGRLFKLLRDIDLKDYMEKEKHFSDFVENKLHTNDNEQPKVFLAGSDQIWNTGASLNPMYFLQFVAPDVIKASYAASMGSSEIAEENIARVRRYLESFDCISVRENGVKESLSRLTNKTINVNIDPTFLLPKESWRKLEKEVRDIPNNYILVYIMHYSRNVNKLLRWLQKETGAKIVVIDSQGTIQGKLTNLIYHDKAIHNAGPEEFLWLVDHAQSIVTSSFHGTAFSIIFEKEFYSIVNPAAPSRLDNLLHMMDLPRVDETEEIFARNHEINWGRVAGVISSERERTKAYLEGIYTLADKPRIKAHKAGNISSIGDMCTGCSACEATCPKEAIKITLNAEGFYRPVLDVDKCVNCGKCLNTCPIENFNGKTRKAAWYGWNANDSILYNSSSGGAFRALADQILCDGHGKIYGAVYTDDYKEVFFSSSDVEQLEQLQKSKYTVSKSSGIYRKIEDDLKNGIQVLFCGTPCQCAGLLSYLQREYPNLLTCDFVCGGMASLAFYREHLECLEKKYDATIKSVDFRPKNKGWGKHHISVKLSNGKSYYVREYMDTYFKCFAIEHISVGKSCLACEFHSLHPADITLADFWGYKAAEVEINPLGTSLLTANTEKGMKAVSALQNFEMHFLDIKHSDYAFGASIPSKKKLQDRDSFFELAQNQGFEKTATDIYGIGFVSQVERWLKMKFGG